MTYSSDDDEVDGLHFILHEDHSIESVSFNRWLEWAKEHLENKASRRRRVAFTPIDGDCVVSTVFIPLNANMSGHGPPRVFETMIFGGPMDNASWQYSSWDEAVSGHAEAVRQAMAGRYDDEPWQEDEPATEIGPLPALHPNVIQAIEEIDVD